MTETTSNSGSWFPAQLNTHEETVQQIVEGDSKRLDLIREATEAARNATIAFVEAIRDHRIEDAARLDRVIKWSQSRVRNLGGMWSR